MRRIVLRWSVLFTRIVGYKHQTEICCARWTKKKLNGILYTHFSIEPNTKANRYYHRYLTKELGELVCESPFTVRLKFEPAGRAVGEVGQYYREIKENRCVVCGASDSYLRKNIVPREYRKYFPSNSFIIK